MPNGGKIKSRSVAGGKTRRRYGKKRSKRTRRRRMLRGGIVI